MPTRLRRAAAEKRNLMADAWTPKVESVMQPLLHSLWNEGASRIAESTADLFAVVGPRWSASLKEVQFPLLFAMAADGYDWAAMELGSKTAVVRMSVKQIEISLETLVRQLREAIADNDSERVLLIHAAMEEQERALASKLRAPIGEWLDRVSPNMAESLATEVKGAFDRAAALNLTPAEIRRELLSKGEALTRIRAETIARTTTIWSYNEGAKRYYRDSGVAELEWYVTSDDALCPFCAPMQGAKTPVNTEFVGGDTILEAEVDGGTRRLPIREPVEHPPLHPNCRCVLLPVV